MPALDSKLRSQLDDVCQKARDLSVAYAQSALQKRAVDAAEPLSHFGSKDKELRNRLRARGRQVGDVRNADGTQSTDQLAQELAYEYWHRMLFARFLAENNLLMHPDGVAVSLEECEELAPTADPPAANGFVLAARYASTMLPQIFRTDDVLLEIEFAPEQRLALEKLLASLPKQTFEADDSLGWVYQFWQTEEKKRVNDSGDKIDGRSLPAVTQLFTEHYMVEFLLHNTIGAWWCAKNGIQGPAGGTGIPANKSPVEMPYLRWRDDGTSACEFDGWPKSLAEFTMLDPCCGSGHFLVAAFNLLVPLRMYEDGLTAVQACEAVLRDNIFGLELDPRCTQIAAFALALAAWKYPDAGGYRPLPTLNIACSGQGVTGKKEEWLALAGGDEKLLNGMDRLYDLFKQAPHLGSLIEPSSTKSELFSAGYLELLPLLSKALEREGLAKNAEALALGVTALGIAKAADLLERKFTLTATNVPYLLRRKQAEALSVFGEETASDSKNDLATIFLSRIVRFGNAKGAFAVVLPQNWLSLVAYKHLRTRLLEKTTWKAVAKLGPGAFQMISGEVVKAILLILENALPDRASDFVGFDVSNSQGADGKSIQLKTHDINLYSQSEQKSHSGSRIIFGQSQDEALLETYGSCYNGMTLGDLLRMKFCFWEIIDRSNIWIPLQSTVDENVPFGGCDSLLRWHGGAGPMKEIPGAFMRGEKVWGKKGILISPMGVIHATLYSGAAFDVSTSVLIPKDTKHLPAMWAFCSSDEYNSSVREVDQQLKVTNATLAQVPFDLEYWQEVANSQFPNGLPAPYSDDPTQWLFKGDIASCTDPLHVAVSRLLDYHWPEQSKTDEAIGKLADSDGILCLPGVRGEAAAAERLLEILRAAYGKNWSESMLHKLLTDAECKAGTTLEDWLRNQFFEQHFKLFHNRPFIWHIWDGRKDGFSALVNYHKLNHKALENLTYSYLGDWITAQGKSDKAGADSRLSAAQELQVKLKMILTGEPPYDIFVRWKPFDVQAIGWHPDLNDGVRMNIRPFMEAGILRKNPNIKWTKDRGSEPNRDRHEYPWFWSGNEFVGDRVNDVHLTNAEKQAARSRMKGAK